MYRRDSSRFDSIWGGGTGEFEEDGVAIWISLLGSYVTGLLRTEPDWSVESGDIDWRK